MTLAQRLRPSVDDGVDTSSLGDTLSSAFARSERTGRPALASLSWPIDPIDPIGLFAAARRSHQHPLLWLQPSRDLALVGLGDAWSVTADGADRFANIRARWDALVDGTDREEPAASDTVGPLLMGGFGFADAVATSSVWRGFERARFVLPALSVSRTDRGTWLTLNHVVTAPDVPTPGQAEESLERWRSLAADTAAAPVASTAGTELPRLGIGEERPAAEEWQASVARFAGAVGRGRLDKVVLTRQVDLVADRAIDVPAVLARLAAGAPESTVFAITRGESTFLGATPERLVAARGREVSTVAMAGSTRRSADAREDEDLARRLLASDKEREEHAVVVQMLRTTLSPLTRTLDVAGAPEVLKLRHVQHLVTPISGQLIEPISILDLVASIHPTPAVGGTPTDLALELIADEERHERGWYAGPIGWVDASGDGEFAVALRSGVVAGEAATLLAGCGIVADSDPEREWAESSVKLQALGSALGHVTT